MKRKQKCLTEEQIQELLNSKYVGDLLNYDFEHLSGIIPINKVKEVADSIISKGAEITMKGEIKHVSMDDVEQLMNESENYIIFYSPYTIHTGDRHFKSVMTLKDGEYGRIVYNERAVAFDGEWYYIRTTINRFKRDEQEISGA